MGSNVETKRLSLCKLQTWLSNWGEVSDILYHLDKDDDVGKRKVEPNNLKIVSFSEFSEVAQMQQHV